MQKQSPENSAKVINIAIDGVAGSGKGTISSKLAETLGFYHMDTGAIYRTITYAALQKLAELQKRAEAKDSSALITMLEKEVALLKNETKLVDVLKSNDFIVHMLKQEDFLVEILKEGRVSIEFQGGKQHNCFDGKDLGQKIREEKIASYTAEVAKHPKVREFTASVQKQAAKENNIIIEGRDIGTEILPDADVKLYINADPEVRAKRRIEQENLPKTEAKFNEVLKLMQERDKADMEREISPLKKADDAIEIDTSHTSQEGSLKSALVAVGAKVPALSDLVVRKLAEIDKAASKREPTK